MQNIKLYIITFITTLMIQACGGESITVTSKQTISITTLAGETKEWQKDPASEKTWYEAEDFCKNSTLEGIDNWRLPSSREFFELIENNKSIDQNFPEESHIKEFWSATETSFDTNKAWKISAWSNSEAYADKNKKFGVRCVSSPTPPLSHTFSQKDGNITDIDPNTNIQLLWQDEIDNKTKLLTYQEAKSYCEERDSRLPTIFELQNTVDKENLSKTNFNNIGSNFTACWSSTPLPTNNSSFLTLNFATGGVSSNDKNSTNYVRCVKTIDTIAPVITLKGINPMTINQNDTYIEPGATITDDIDKSPTISIHAEVDTTKVGTYIITYTSSDDTGNIATKIRTVHVIDATIPVIILLGDNPQIIEIATAYTELNATAYDAVDGNISDKIDINSSAVDINSIGEYTVRYNVSDEEGNDAITKTRTIKIIETSAFIPHLITQNAINSEWLEMADMDNDGDLDILSASRGGAQAGAVQDAWYENLGNDSNFTQRIINTDETGEVTSISVAKLPDSSTLINDDYLDIVYTVPLETNSIRKCINNQDKTFTCGILKDTNANPSPISTTNSSSAIALIDINNNGSGISDIVAISEGLGQIDWYHQWTAGFQGPQSVDSTIANVISIDYADFNNDNTIDIVAASNSSDEIFWYQNENDGIDDVNFTKHGINGTINGVYSVNTADIDGDGDADIISTSNTDGKVYWHKNNDSNFDLPIEIITNLSNVKYASGVDMDNDGDIDILSNSSEENGKIVWYENIGENSNFTEHIVAYGQDYVIRVFAADIDNDGNMDVVAGQADGNIIYYENTNPTIEKKLLKTGQTTQYYPKDDGDLEKGATRDYTRENDHVIDNHTGLMWHDDTNVSSMTKNWENATKYCKDSTLDSYDDWRVPTPLELIFIVDKGKDDPAIDENFFNTNTIKSYWTNHIEKNDADNIFTINFLYGKDLEDQDRTISRHIRCVRGHSLKSNFQRDDDNYVVNDVTRKLTWQDSIDPETYNKDWEEAINYCQTKGSGWRLPNIFELFTIVDHSKRNDTTNNIFKHENENEKYWSSTTDLDDTGKARSIDFEIGHDWNSGKNDNAYIRCVKDMP